MTAAFPLVVQFLDDDEDPPVYQARRDADGLYSIQGVGRWRYHPEELYVIARADSTVIEVFDEARYVAAVDGVLVGTCIACGRSWMVTAITTDARCPFEHNPFIQ